MNNYNPFDTINARLSNLEALTLETLNCLRTTATTTSPEVGGIELAQEITRLSKTRLYALVSARGIPHAKRGNKLYFNRKDLLAWVENGRRSEADGSSVYVSKPGRRGRNATR
ncbi:helix-turn-helix domain-containing protein [Hymenobacter sp. BT523]|uniref:helix-turn-helix domain-containing protein n=1 Tax=Hymenobacter sp. BT523 TaxID=2795725 RepID=UPI0018EBD04A|nr:helix-turn-helix domain-containing protein [Hymenobacter sp. BT523]